MALENCKVPKGKKVLTQRINTLTIRLSGDGYKCCFDVLVNGLKLTSDLTLGELLEFIAGAFVNQNHSICYLDDFGKFDFCR